LAEKPRRRSGGEVCDVSKGVRDARNDFSAANFAKTTCLWLAALKRRESSVFPTVYNLAQAASRCDVKQGEVLTGLDLTANTRADIESDESEEAADAADDADADADMEEVNKIMDDTSDNGSRLHNRTGVVQRK
jgi:hypothetical protein